MEMRSAVFLLVLLLNGCSTTNSRFEDSAPVAKPWLERVPSSLSNWREWVELHEEAFFEVPASKLATAEYWLTDVSFKPLEQSGVTYFGRPEFKCPASTMPYLLRAGYVNGGTGDFSLAWAGTSIVVSHRALGRSGVPFQSALVACLANAPSDVYSSISGAL
jgi:hypothetical protein